MGPVLGPVLSIVDQPISMIEPAVAARYRAWVSLMVMQLQRTDNMLAVLPAKLLLREVLLEYQNLDTGQSRGSLDPPRMRRWICQGLRNCRWRLLNLAAGVFLRAVAGLDLELRPDPIPQCQTRSRLSKLHLRRLK